jgi:hypothetical protein
MTTTTKRAKETNASFIFDDLPSDEPSMVLLQGSILWNRFDRIYG